MTSLINTTAEAAHSVAVSLLSKAQVQPGSTITEHSVKETAPDASVPLKLSPGRTVIVRIVSSQFLDLVLILLGWRTWCLFWHLHCSDSRVHTKIRSVQG